MELADGTRDVVDPEVRAYVSSLVTALGGSGADEDGRYILGDDALACLRDLKRWLKLYDEKANRLDVARCLAESNLVNGDLLQILAAWPENATDDKYKSRIALACVELLVPLTWPLDKNREMTVNHHRHMPFLQLAQLGYKRSIINFDGERILHTAVRVALPSMAVDLKERSSRDEGVIKLVLYFLRNITMIEPPPGIAYNDGDEIEISRSALIDAFQWQDIFHLLLALCSSMGEEFNTQDVVVMEILFHLIKGVDIERLFMNEQQLDKHKMDELVSLRNKEAGLLRGYQRTAPTRHNRFGTMIWVKREGEKMSSVSGQDALINGAKTLEKMDKAKRFRPPNRALKGETGPMNFDLPVPLNPRASKSLRTFVEDFLDSGFNPLFQHIRKAIDREAERVLDFHPRQYFYLVSWFLEAERVRRASKKSANSKSRIPAAGEDTDSFGLIASVMNQEMFITLNRAMQKNYEEKAWQDLNAAMKCFTQILLTVQEMSESPLEEDQEIAENILSRIFYEETTHDRVAYIVRYYKDQGFGYLDACTELTHVYLRILENYSKQNTEMQVRSRRRIRGRKKAEQRTEGAVDEDEIDESEDDAADAERTSSERKFDFKRFAARFLAQGCVDTFVKFCAYYNDLKPEQLKRAHRFFYRVAFKMEMSVMLFRVDIIALLHKMMRGPDGLDPSSPVYKEWDELVKQIIKRCTRKIQERPVLLVEMLFSKTNSTAHYLEYGYEKQTIESKVRPAAELEVKPGLDPLVAPISVVVSALLDRNEGEHLDWLKTHLRAAKRERHDWEMANNPVTALEATLGSEEHDSSVQPPPEVQANIDKVGEAGASSLAPSIVLTPDNDTRRLALFKNGCLRFLLRLIDCELTSDTDDPNTTWIIPSHVLEFQIEESLNLIQKAEFDPPSFDDGRTAEDFIRRKSAASSSRRRAAFDDDSDNGIIDDDEELFPLGGPTPAPRNKALDELKKTRRRRRRKSTSGSDEDSEINEEDLDARRAARREKELEKRRKIKSALYVHDSDEESDEERDRAFFEQEEKLRKRMGVEAVRSLLGLGKKDKQKPGLITGEEDITLSGILAGDNSDVDSPGGTAPEATAAAEKEAGSQKNKRKRRTYGGFIDSDSDGDSGSEQEIDGPEHISSDTALSSDHHDTEEEGEHHHETDTADTPLSTSSPQSQSHQSQSQPPQDKTRRKRLRLSNANTGAHDDDDGENSEPGSRLGTPEDDGDVEMAGVDKIVSASAVVGIGEDEDDEDDEDGGVVLAPSRRGRGRAGMVIDSSDEE